MVRAGPGALHQDWFEVGPLARDTDTAAGIPCRLAPPRRQQPDGVSTSTVFTVRRLRRARTDGLNRPAPRSSSSLGLTRGSRAAAAASCSRAARQVDQPPGEPGSTWGDAHGPCEWIAALWSRSTLNATSAGMTGWWCSLGRVKDGDHRHKSCGEASRLDLAAAPPERPCGTTARPVALGFHGKRACTRSTSPPRRAGKA